MNRLTSERSIAVIGAGISGLAAARCLADAGYRVCVFERGRSVGGRTASKVLIDPNDDARHRVDCGAQYFSARDARFIDAVKSAQRDGSVALWPGRVVKYNSDGGQESLSERYVGVPAMNALAKHLADGLAVFTSTPITSIEYHNQQASGGKVNNGQGKKWTLHSDDAIACDTAFDAVVIGMPPEQAVRLIKPTAAMRTAPAFGALNDIRSLACWAACVSFDEVLDLPFDGAFLNDSVLSWVARDSGKPGRGAGERWVLHASSDWAAQRLAEQPEAVASAMINAFFDSVGHRRVMPRQSVAHRWSFARVAEKQYIDEGCLWDPRLQLAVCGDWCIEAKVEGAYLSGVAAAESILATW